MDAKKEKISWKNAERPNYGTNFDREFPYSELPYVGDNRLEKIPNDPEGRVEHVNYWGEGKTDPKQPTSFSTCYNINLQYHLVSNGPDKGRKIPNRIPLINTTDCDTSNYIKWNSVSTVTIDGKKLNDCTAKDIARMTVRDFGRVIVYGAEIDEPGIQKLKTELRLANLTPLVGVELPREFVNRNVDKYVVFMNTWSKREEIQYLVRRKNYKNTENLTRELVDNNTEENTKESIRWLINSDPTNNIAYAFHLWKNGAKDIVKKYFPKSYSLICNEDVVTIVNKNYNTALKLSQETDAKENRRAIVSPVKTVNEAKWKLIPIYEGKKVIFKIYNLNHDQYLNLDANVSNFGDRKVWGSNDSDDPRFTFFLNCVVKDGEVTFNIYSNQYGIGLIVPNDIDLSGNRNVLAYFGNLYLQGDRGKWLIETWKSASS